MLLAIYASLIDDSLGRRTSEKDQAGKVTRFGYDCLGRLIKVIDPLNQETIYTYVHRQK